MLLEGGDCVQLRGWNLGGQQQGDGPVREEGRVEIEEGEE